MEINFVFISAMVVIVVSIVSGAIRGFLKSSLSLAALLISLILIPVLNPLVTGLLKNHTGLDEWVADRVDLAIAGKLEHVAEKTLGLEDIPEENGMVTLPGDVTLPMDITLPDGTKLPAGTVIPGGTTVPTDILGGEQAKEQVKKQVDTGLSAAEQGKLIDLLPLPESLRDSIAEHNNTAVYEQLGVETFTDYIGSFAAQVCLNIVGCVITFLIVFFALHILILAFNIVDRLPIIHGINHFAGAILGIFKGFLLLEVLFLLLVPFASTDFGGSVLAQINANGFLSALYHGNLLMKFLI